MKTEEGERRCGGDSRSIALGRRDERRGRDERRRVWRRIRTEMTTGRRTGNPCYRWMLATSVRGRRVNEETRVRSGERETDGGDGSVLDLGQSGSETAESATMRWLTGGVDCYHGVKQRRRICESIGCERERWWMQSGVADLGRRRRGEDRVGWGLSLDKAAVTGGDRFVAGNKRRPCRRCGRRRATVCCCRRRTRNRDREERDERLAAAAQAVGKWEERGGASAGFAGSMQDLDLTLGWV